MTVKRQKKNKMTPGEYLALERSSLDIKHEFFDGDVFAMVGAGINHNRININLAGELRNTFKADKSPHVEQYIRSDNGKWEYRSYESPEQMLNMESVNCDVLLSEIYLNVNFETQSRED
jgi:Uma2 family endonuclease